MTIFLDNGPKLYISEQLVSNTNLTRWTYSELFGVNKKVI